MDVTDSSAKFWLDVAQMDVHQDSASRSWQDEPVCSKTIEDPIHLFGRFVSVISSDTLKDIRPRTEVSRGLLCGLDGEAKFQSQLSTFVRDLCVKAPSVAQYLVQEILSFSKDDSQPEVPGSKELETSTSTKGSSKRKNQSDRSYRLPRSSRIQRLTLRDRAEDSPEVPGISSQVGNKLGTSQTSYDTTQSSDSIITSPPVPKCEDHVYKILAEEVPQVPQVPQDGVAPQEAAQVQSPAPSSTMLLMASESALHQLKATHSNEIIKGREFRRQPLVTLDEPAKDSRHGLHPPSPSEAEQRETALPEIEEKVSDTQVPSATFLPHRVELHETTSPGPNPSTPTLQIGAGFQSSLSDDVTLQTALFMPIANREVLSPLIEDDQTALPPYNIEMTLPKGIPSPPPSTQQQRSPCSTILTPAQHVDREQPLSTQDSPVGLSPSLLEELPPLASMVAKQLISFIR
jgi:hypothetical protein